MKLSGFYLIKDKNSKIKLNNHKKLKEKEDLLPLIILS